MRIENERAAVPLASTGTDAGRPLSKKSKFSISVSEPENKSADKYLSDDFQARLRAVQRRSDPAALPTVSMNELYENVYQSRPPVIDGLLCTGTYLLAGAPKVGKSFLVAQLAYHVSTGLPLWNYTVHRSPVLYLALEDDYQRLQERMFRMFSVEGTDDLRFAVCAKLLGRGLDEQLEKFLRERPDTKLIIIDTLQKVLETSGEGYSYANDYKTISRFKQFADRHGICLLLVHHTRKMPAGDNFEMISGTTGLLGSADGAFLLRKERRTALSATLDIVSRDQPDQRLYLVRDEVHLTWNLDHAETELWKAPPDPVLEAVAALLSPAAPCWEGSPTQLAKAMRLDIPANVLTKHLNVCAGRLLAELNIRYVSSVRHEGRRIQLTLGSACAVTDTEGIA